MVGAETENAHLAICVVVLCIQPDVSVDTTYQMTTVQKVWVLRCQGTNNLLNIL